MGLFGGPSKKQIQQARMRLQMEQAQRLAEAKAKAQQIISLSEGMKTDAKCHDLMDQIDCAMEANRDSLLSVACNPEPITQSNIGIFLYTDDTEAKPWDLDRKKSIKIDYISYGLSLTGLNGAAFMYWLLERYPFLTYKDGRGPSRDMNDVLSHCLDTITMRALMTLYNTRKL